MPEGPEVETIVRGLQTIVGSSIWSVDSSGLKGLLKNCDEAKLQSSLTMMRIDSVERYGKWILFTLVSPNPAEPRVGFVSHLGMFGHWRIWWNKVGASLTHPRLTISLGTPQGPAFLTYSDMRSWGRLYIFPQAAAKKFLLGRVGVDATLITPEHVTKCLQKDIRPIAEILLDQSKIAGIGNIYRSEILWCAEIAPDRPGTDITDAECTTLYECIRRVISHAIRLRGSSIQDYRDTNGEHGEFQKALMAYEQKNKPCTRCMIADPMNINPWPVIEATKEIDGRTVYHCPQCQK